jgi:hypothetical protein
VKDVQNVNDSPFLAVIDQVFASQEAGDAGRDIIALSAYKWIVAQQSKTLLD